MNPDILDAESPPPPKEEEDIIEHPYERPETALERAIGSGNALTDDQIGTEAAISAFGPRALLMDPETAAKIVSQREQARVGLSVQQSLPPWTLSEDGLVILRRLVKENQAIVEDADGRHWPPGPQDPPITPAAFEELTRCFDFLEGQMMGGVRYVEIAAGGRSFLEMLDGIKPMVEPGLWCESCAAFHRGGAALHG